VEVDDTGDGEVDEVIGVVVVGWIFGFFSGSLLNSAIAKILLGANGRSPPRHSLKFELKLGY
jgi:hypothetical protein